MKKSTRILALVTALLFALSLVLIIGIDTNWGKAELTNMTLVTPDGDEISALMWRPLSATPENPAPCVLYCHGGNDMKEQGSSYAVELVRRGYVVVAWDYSNCARSDIATGTSETASNPVTGAPTMGGETVWNTIKTFNFIDHGKIITAGHSMGGQYSMGLAMKHQQEVFLQVTLGMNFWGAADNQQRDFNFANVLGDSDESTLARNPSIAKVLKTNSCAASSLAIIPAKRINCPPSRSASATPSPAPTVRNTTVPVISPTAATLITWWTMTPSAPWFTPLPARLDWALTKA
jgi:pimeloyl-ACP methyl ester carboxylesterase